MSTDFTFRHPPVIFIWVRRFPWSSLDILNIFAPKVCGYSGTVPYRMIPPSSSSTPSSFKAEPKQQGNSLRPLISRRIVSSATSPVSRKCSSAASSHMATCSMKSCVPVWEKSTQASSSLVLISLNSASRSVPAWSILLINRNVGILYFASRRHKVTVWPCTPSLPLMTRTA